jgi:hypothetical protein
MKFCTRKKITKFRKILSNYVQLNFAKFRGIVEDFTRNMEDTEVQKTYEIPCRRNSVDKTPYVRVKNR